MERNVQIFVHEITGTVHVIDGGWDAIVELGGLRALLGESGYEHWWNYNALREGVRLNFGKPGTRLDTEKRLKLIKIIESKYNTDGL